MSYIVLIFGVFEYFDWCFGRKGAIGGVIYQLISQINKLMSYDSQEILTQDIQHPLLQLIQNPLIAVYICLWISFSRSLKRDIQFVALTKISFINQPWIPRASLSIQALCLVLLVYQLRKVLITIIEGNYFYSDKNSLLFGSIISLIFLIQFVLRNIPEINEIPIEKQILGSDVVGLYALRSDQFALQENLGNGKLELLTGHRYEKGKNTQWFIFSRGIAFHGESTNMDVGSIQLKYSWWATVTDYPSEVIVSEVSLAGIESREQFKQKIHLTCTNEYRSLIHKQPRYETIERQLNELVQVQTQSFAYTPELFSEQLAKVALLHQQIDDFKTQLLSDGIWSQKIHGGLYSFQFHPISISLTVAASRRLESFEQNIKDQADLWYRRLRDKQSFSLEFVNTVTSAFDLIGDRISRPTRDEIFKGLISSIANHLELPKATKDDILQSLEESINTDE
jgi:hypothetical protein